MEIGTAFDLAVLCAYDARHRVGHQSIYTVSGTLIFDQREKMAPVHEPLPETGPAPETAKRGWEMQVGMTLACTNGEDKGLQARYTATSVGGKRAVQALALAIADQADKNPDKPVPLVRLKKEHYQHKSYGRIYTPVFEVLEWVGLNGEGASEEAPAAEPAAGGRRRRV